MGDTVIVVTVADFRAAFPEFTVELYPDAVVERFIAQSYCNISPNTYGCLLENCRKLAIELMIAHLLTIWKQSMQSGQGGSSGTILSSKIDEVSVQFVAPPVKTLWQTWIYSTSYGQQFNALLMSHASVPAYIGGSRNKLFWTNR